MEQGGDVKLVGFLPPETTSGGFAGVHEQGVGVISAPLRFYEDFLHMDLSYITYLRAKLAEKVHPRFKLAVLSFPDIKEVRLSFLVSGIVSSKLRTIITNVIQQQMPQKRTLGDQIRALDKGLVESLMTQEITTNLEKL